MTESDAQRAEAMPEEEAQPTVVIPRAPRFARFRRGSDEGTSASAPIDPAEADPSHTAILISPERLDGEDTVIIPVPYVPPDGADSAEVADPETPPRHSLERERKSLIDQREFALYHLGGLAFEVHRRDLLPDGAMQERAESVAAMERRLTEIDTQIVALAAAKTERREQRSRPDAPVIPPTVGTCSACDTGYFAGALFCFHCGAALDAARGDDAESSELATRD